MIIQFYRTFMLQQVYLFQTDTYTKNLFVTAKLSHCVEATKSIGRSLCSFLKGRGLLSFLLFHWCLPPKHYTYWVRWDASRAEFYWTDRSFPASFAAFVGMVWVWYDTIQIPCLTVFVFEEKTYMWYCVRFRGQTYMWYFLTCDLC